MKDFAASFMTLQCCFQRSIPTPRRVKVQLSDADRRHAARTPADRLRTGWSEGRSTRGYVAGLAPSRESRCCRPTKTGAPSTERPDKTESDPRSLVQERDRRSSSRRARRSTAPPLAPGDHGTYPIRRPPVRLRHRIRFRHGRVRERRGRHRPGPAAGEAPAVADQIRRAVPALQTGPYNGYPQRPQEDRCGGPVPDVGLPSPPTGRAVRFRPVRTASGSRHVCRRQVLSCQMAKLRAAA